MVIKWIKNSKILYLNSIFLYSYKQVAPQIGTIKDV